MIKSFQTILRMSFSAYTIRISFIVILLIGAGWLAWSCGWSEDECDSYTGFMSPTITSAPKSAPFFYSPHMFFNECNLETQEANDEVRWLNELDWQKYTGSSVSKEAISTFINNTSLDTLNHFYNFLEKKKSFTFSQPFQENEMTKWFKQSKDLEALGYILYAKKCEVVSSSSDSWEPPLVDTVYCRNMIKNGIQLYKAAKRDFIKKRYALQIVKTTFYGKFYSDVLKYYNQFYIPVKKDYTIIDGRIDGYKAGALYKLGHKLESAYTFSRLFDEANDPDAAYSHTLGFVWSLKMDSVEHIAQLATNPHEKSMVYALAGMRDVETYSQKWIQKVVDLEPSNKYLEVLLLRELNKLENEYLNSRYQIERGYSIYDAYFGGVQQKTSSYELEEWNLVNDKAKQNLQNFSSYILKLASDPKVPNKALWYMASAYLDFIQGRNEDCIKSINLAKSHNPHAKTFAQIRVIELLHSISSLKSFNEMANEKLATELKWLEQYGRSNADFNRIFKNILKTELPKKFALVKDSIRMTMCYHRYENAQNAYYRDQSGDEEPNSLKHFSDLYFSISGGLIDHCFTQEQLDTLLTFIQYPKSPLDKWLLEHSLYTPEIVREIKAVKYFRSLDYSTARGIISKNQEQITVPNLFVTHARDYQDGYADDTLKSYTMYEVLDTLISLKAKKLVDLNSAFHYACALYSLSYHGKCHGAWNFHRDATAIDPYFRDTLLQTYTPFEKQFYYADEAYEVFQFVLSQKPGLDLKQKTLWMLAKCEQKRCSTTKPDYLGWYSNEEKWVKDYVGWNVNNNKYLSQFYNLCKGSAFYESVYQECSYLQLYAKQH